MIFFLSAALGGCGLALSFPPQGFEFFAWVAFIPLFAGISRAHCLKRAAALSAVFGAAFLIIDVNWIYATLVTHGHFSPFMAAAMLAGLVAILDVFFAAFGFGLAFCLSQGVGVFLIAPALWVTQEILRTVVFTGFPWDLLGYSQMNRLPVVQIADITGVYGVSFVIVLVNAALWETMNALQMKKKPPWLHIGVAGLVVLCCIFYGKIRLDDFRANNDAEAYKYGILQGNIPQEVKWDEKMKDVTFSTYRRIGESAVKEGAELLIWPETSAPVIFGARDGSWKQANSISTELGTPMLVGAPSGDSIEGQTRFYNSAFLLDGNSVLSYYHKIHLVPFGEYMPLSGFLPLGPGIAAREADYTAGQTMSVMRVNESHKFSVLICYEAIFPDLARQAISNGARLLINITNDGWFGDSGAPYQHLNMCAMRSIENRVWMLRSANTGVSAAFDPAGRMVKSVPLQHEGFFVVSVPKASGQRSIYSCIGDVFAWTCAAFSGIFVLGSMFRRTRSMGGT